mmetsp:Transcript_61621/g.161890  ORF Transcript_61621/g.161890 Transcript_61621/m.161890 type:complete len:200 (+) Transcript_61621:358-957(+)
MKCSPCLHTVATLNRTDHVCALALRQRRQAGVDLDVELLDILDLLGRPGVVTILVHEHLPAHNLRALRRPCQHRLQLGVHAGDVHHDLAPPRDEVALFVLEHVGLARALVVNKRFTLALGHLLRLLLDRGHQVRHTLQCQPRVVAHLAQLRVLAAQVDDLVLQLVLPLNHQQHLLLHLLHRRLRRPAHSGSSSSLAYGS